MTETATTEPTEPTPFELELERARTERAERERIKARAAKADELEMHNAFLLAGIPDTGIGRLFMETYDDEPTVEAVRIAWADVVDRDDFLTASERFQRELRRARAAERTAS